MQLHISNTKFSVIRLTEIINLIGADVFFHDEVNLGNMLFIYIRFFNSQVL